MSTTAVLDLNVKGFSTGLATVEKGLKAISSTVAKTGSLMGSAFSKGISGIAGLVKGLSVAGAGALAGLGAGVFEAMNQGGELVDLQEQTGVSIEKLMQLRVAFEQAGLGADEVQPVIAKLQKTIVGAQTGSEAAQKAFQALGLSADDLAETTADEQLRLVGESIAAIENPALKSAVAMEVFGKSGGRMLAFFAAGGLDEAAAAIGRQGELMAKYADTFDAITDSFGLYHTKLRGFFVGVASQLAPVLKMAADWFKTVDIAAIGENVGNVIASIYGTIQKGNLSELISTAFKIGFGDGINYFYAGLQAVGASLQEFFSGALGGIQSYFSGLGTLLMGIGKQFVSFILNGIASAFMEMRDLPVVGDKFFRASNAMQAKGYQMSLAANRSMAEGADEMAAALPTLDAFGNRLVSAGKAFAAEFKRAGGTPVIDLAAEKEKLRTLMDEGRTEAERMQAELGAKPRASEKPVLERDILDVLNTKQPPPVPSRAQQVFGMFGSLGGGTVRGSFQTLDPMVSQQKQTNALLKQVVTNTNKAPSAPVPAYQN
jgi:hypothetical protein